MILAKHSPDAFALLRQFGPGITNSHSFRRWPPGSLQVVGIREDLEADGWLITVHLAPSCVVEADVCRPVNFTALFRGFRDVTAAHRTAESRRERRFRRWQEELQREMKLAASA